MAPFTMVRCGGRGFSLKSITVEPVMFIYMYTTFTQFLTIQALIYSKVCYENYNSTVCENLKNETFKPQQDFVQKHTSTWLLYINLCMGVPSLFTVLLFLGPWGDRVGRKLPVLVPLLGALFASVCNLINSIHMELSLGYLLIGCILNGLCGGFIAGLMAMYSYVAHISTPANRTIKIGILEAMVFLSGCLGTATSGVMLDRTSYVFVFSVLSAIIALALLYAFLWLDNIVPEQEDGNIQSRGSFCSLMLDSVKDIFQCVYKNRHNKNFFNLLLVMIIIFALMLVTVGEADILLLYTRADPFNWSQTTLGLYKGTEAFLRGFSVLTLLPLFIKKLKVRDTVLILCGLVSKMAALLVLGVGTKTAVLFIGAVVGILMGFASAGVRSLCSGMVEKHEQAKIFSLIGIFESLAQLAATSLFNTVYNATLNFYHGFCFLMAAAIIAVTAIISSFLHFKLRNSENYATLSSDIEVNEDVAQDPPADRVDCSPINP